MKRMCVFWVCLYSKLRCIRAFRSRLRPNCGSNWVPMIECQSLKQALFILG